MEHAQELNNLIEEKYIPSSTERKKALLMYFFVGILAGMSQKQLTPYEYYHLKQSLGWWCVFFIVLVASIFLLFIPYIWIVPMFIFLLFLVVWVYFVRQAWKGYYVVGNDKIVLPFFSGIGHWIINIFEFKLEVVTEEQLLDQKLAPQQGDQSESQDQTENN